MSRPEELDGSESVREGLTPRSEGITPGPSPEADRGDPVELLEPVWRDSQGHDEWCEADWHPGVARHAPCGCGDRAGSGIYPDGRRAPE